MTHTEAKGLRRGLPEPLAHHDVVDPLPANPILALPNTLDLEAELFVEGDRAGVRGEHLEARLPELPVAHPFEEALDHGPPEAHVPISVTDRDADRADVALLGRASPMGIGLSHDFPAALGDEEDRALAIELADPLLLLREVDSDGPHSDI